MHILEYLENGTELFYEIKKNLTCASDDTFWEIIVLLRSIPLRSFKVNNIIHV